MCQFYEQHKQPDISRTLAQFVSMALYLNPAPNLTAKVKEADMPPDAVAVLGILPMLQKFYETAGHTWHMGRKPPSLLSLTERYHKPLGQDIV